MVVDCSYIGDSIAVGLQQLDPRCAVHAKIGANTDYIVKHFAGQGGLRYTIISMGSNWPDNPHNIENIIELRRGIRSDKVIWILPYNRKIACLIAKIAVQYRDSFVDLAPFNSKDHVHPAYKPVNKKINDILDMVFD